MSAHSTLLIIDTNYLCHRAFHAMGDLSHGDAATGAIYGVLRDVVQFQEQFGSTRCVFAFDPGGVGHRARAVPGYKASRAKRYEDEDEDTKARRVGFHEQVRALRNDYLPSIGFSNVFCTEGFEADDIIASVAARVPSDQEAVIIGSDHDLWQCLRENVWCWNPHTKKGMDAAAFTEKWGLKPDWWAHVRAYAGCSSDDVVGVPGIGEKKAADYLRGTMNKNTATYAKIARAGDVYQRNYPVVCLPFAGTPIYELRPDTVTAQKWADVTVRLGMRSLRDAPPLAAAAARQSRGRKRARTYIKGFF